MGVADLPAGDLERGGGLRVRDTRPQPAEHLESAGSTILQ